jgi:hypothetical protein
MYNKPEAGDGLQPRLIRIVIKISDTSYNTGSAKLPIPAMKAKISGA